jgi:hypothetical protein
LYRLIQPLQGRAWWLAATVTFCTVLGVATYHLWLRHGDQILTQPRYRLNPERLKVTPQPDWVRTDIVDSAVTLGRLHHASLLDKELVLRVKQAFGVQPWVKRVTCVNKRFPSTVEVELEYRRPLAMVVVPAGLIPPHNYDGVLPVDEDGYLLPVEMTKEEGALFPRITGVDASPTGPPGNPWGDMRVAAAARIVVLVEDLWQRLDLHEIEVPPRDAEIDTAPSEQFVLVTRAGSRWTWGSAPGHEARGEHTASQKVAALREVAEQFGSLDAWLKTDNPRLSDLLMRRNNKR